MKIWVMLIMRPRIASGVNICLTVLRMIELNPSNMPTRMSASMVNQNMLETPKSIVARPKPTTEMEINIP